MKVRIKKSAFKIKARLRGFSSRRRKLAAKEQLAPSSPSHPRTVVKFNLSGNRRGMHNADRPPSSEHMRKIRAMRQFYNKQMPVLQCSSCSFASSCSKFRAGYECAFLPFLNAHRIRNETDLLESMQELCATGMRRAHLATIMETLTGAAPSLENSEALNLVFHQLKELHELTNNGGMGVTVETEDETIIGKLFGGLDKLINHTNQSRANPIDVPVTIKALPDAEPLMPDVFNPDVNRDLIRAHTKADLEKFTNKGGEILVSSL